LRTRVFPFEGRIASEWDRFNERSPTGTVFTSSNWLAVFRRPAGLTIRLLLAESDGQWLCGVPLAIRTKGPFRSAMPIGASPYFGFVISPGLQTEPHQDLPNNPVALLASEILTQVHYAEIPNVPGWRVDVPPRWEVEERKTYTRTLNDGIGHKPPEKDVRYELRKAERSKLRVEPSENPEVFVDLMRDAFRAKRLDAPVSASAFLELYGELRPGGRISVYLARRGEDVAAGAVILHDRRAHYYWLAATSSAFRSTGASYLLLQEIVKDLSRKGPRELDLVGANVPGVARFKAHFASQTASYLVLKGYSSTAARVTHRAYQRLHRIRGFR